MTCDWCEREVGERLQSKDECICDACWFLLDKKDYDFKEAYNVD